LHTLSGGQRRRVELSRILFASTGSDATLLLDEPTNHLDADSIIWLRDYLRTYKGGLVVISHDVGLLEHTVTRVFHLDANAPRSTCTTSGGTPTSCSARPTSDAASASGPTPRSRRAR
jgi:ATPase subunit of ABC transporter with duplicated ATPase domains